MEIDYNIKSRPIHNIRKIGRNDKCWCGSTIKYKNCCYEKDNIFGDKYDQPIYRQNSEKLYNKVKQPDNE